MQIFLPMWLAPVDASSLYRSIGAHRAFAVKSTSLFLMHVLTIFKAHESDCSYWSVFVSFQQTVIPSGYLMVRVPCKNMTNILSRNTEFDFAVLSVWGLINRMWGDPDRMQKTLSSALGAACCNGRAECQFFMLKTKTRQYFWLILIARFHVARHVCNSVNCVRAVLSCKSIHVET